MARFSLLLPCVVSVLSFAYVRSLPDFGFKLSDLESLSEKIFAGFKGSNLACPYPMKPNMTLGTPHPNATLLEKVKLIEPGLIWPFRAEKKHSWPPKLKDPKFENANITHMKFENHDTSCQCFGNFLKIHDGGPGHNFVKVDMLSEAGCPMNYTLHLYGFPKGLKDSKDFKDISKDFKDINKDFKDSRDSKDLKDTKDSDIAKE